MAFQIKILNLRVLIRGSGSERTQIHTTSVRFSVNMLSAENILNKHLVFQAVIKTTLASHQNLRVLIYAPNGFSFLSQVMVSEGRRAGSVRAEQVNCADPPASTCWLSGWRSSTVPRLNTTVSLKFTVMPVFIVLVQIKSMHFWKTPKIWKP